MEGQASPKVLSQGQERWVVHSVTAGSMAGVGREDFPYVYITERLHLYPSTVWPKKQQRRDLQKSWLLAPLLQAGKVASQSTSQRLCGHGPVIEIYSRSRNMA